MPHGSPDYGEYAALETVGRLVDLGELAVRLGALSQYNREGNVVFQDNFEHTPLKWVKREFGSGGSIVYSDTKAWSGGQSVKITTGAVSGYWVFMRRDFPLLSKSKLGLEIAFLPVTTKETIIVNMYWYTGTQNYQCLTRMNLNTRLLQINDLSEGYVDIEDDLKLYEGKHLFHPYKIVFDANTMKYVRVIIDQTEYDLSTYTLSPTTDTAYPHIDVQYGVQAEEGAAKVCYMDNFILTQNEV